MTRLLKQFILTAMLAWFASQASALFVQPDTFDPRMQGVGTNRYAYAGVILLIAAIKMGISMYILAVLGIMLAQTHLLAD